MGSECRYQSYHQLVIIKGFFDNIDYDLLIKFIREEITDGWVLDIIESWLTVGVMTESIKQPSSEGRPQGGYKLVRFADDSVPRRFVCYT